MTKPPTRNINHRNYLIIMAKTTTPKYIRTLMKLKKQAEREFVKGKEKKERTTTLSA